MDLQIYCRGPQGLAVIFSHRQVCVKREGRTLFLLPKVKVEFRHLFSLQKRFSLCSYHNINANIVVFCWLTGLQWNSTRFLNSKRSGQLLIILISGLYGLNNIDRNKKNRNIILKSRKKRQFKSLALKCIFSLSQSIWKYRKTAF